VIETKSWRIPPIFDFLRRSGKVDPREMYQVFNMGIGMAAIVSAKDAKQVAGQLKAKQIGRIERGRGKTQLIQ
jgi:phosphoribosylformylglycinamidine cyclo-ligase